MEKIFLTQENTFWRSETSIPFYWVDLRPKNQVHLAVKSEFLSKNDHENDQIWEKVRLPGAQKHEKKIQIDPKSLEPG